MLLIKNIESGFSPNIEIKQNKYLNNIIEQHYRAIKRITKPMMGFHSFYTDHRTLKGIESIHMLNKGQVVEIQCAIAKYNLLTEY